MLRQTFRLKLLTIFERCVNTADGCVPPQIILRDVRDSTTRADGQIMWCVDGQTPIRGQYSHSGPMFYSIGKAERYRLESSGSSL